MPDDHSPFGGRPSRRAFLQSLTMLAAAAGCDRGAYRPGDFTRPVMSPVALLPAGRYDGDLEGVIAQGLDLLQVDVRGRRVLLKPNMVEYERDKAINSHPAVVAAAANALLSRGAAHVGIGEGPGHRRDIEYLLHGTGMQDVLRDLRVEFIDLNHDDVRRVPLRSNFSRLREIWLPTPVLEADFVVTMPKLKTHHFAGMTASMKNLFGAVPGAVYGWPKNILHFHGIEQSIVDLTATIRPALTIVDGIVAMEGDGPIMGRPRHLGVIAMGTDVVAVDATCARVIGLDPGKMPYLAVSGAFLGNTDESRIVQRGEPLARYRSTFDVIPSIRKMRL